MSDFRKNLEEEAGRIIEIALEAWIWVVVAAVAASLYRPLRSIVGQLLDAQKRPIQLSALSAVYVLVLLLILAIAIVALLLFVRSKIREAKELRMHKCPTVSGSSELKSHVGEQFTYPFVGVSWTPVLIEVDGAAGDSIRVSGPLCVRCGAPLYFEDALIAEQAECPTCESVSKFDTYIHALREKARAHAIGLASRGKLVFPTKTK